MEPKTSEERQTEISIDSKHLHVFLGGFVKCAIFTTTTIMAQKGCGISLTFEMFLTDQLQFDFRPEKVKPKITINGVNVAGLNRSLNLF